MQKQKIIFFNLSISFKQITQKLTSFDSINQFFKNVFLYILLLFIWYTLIQCICFICYCFLSLINGNMKKDDYSSEESSKTFNCRPKFQLIPNKFITQDNPYFSAFSQRRFKILSSKDISHVKKTLKMENELDKTQNGKGKPSSLLMSRKINEFNVL